MGHINGRSLQRFQEGPNHLLSGSTAALRSCQTGKVGGTLGIQGRAALWMGLQAVGAIFCRKGGDRARLGSQSPRLVGLHVGLCFVAASS